MNNMTNNNSTNFEEWYKENQKSESAVDSWGTGQKEACKVTWDACKNEVIKILENHSDNDGFSQSVLLEKINKEI